MLDKKNLITGDEKAILVSVIQKDQKEEEANEYLDEIDKYFALVPSFKDIKSFLKGIHGMEQITAGEYAHIMKVNLKTILFN